MTNRTKDRIWTLINKGDYDKAADYIVNHVNPDELTKAIAYALQALENAIIGIYG